MKTTKKKRKNIDRFQGLARPGIYKIRCKTNNKCYVGLAKNIKSRWSQHRYELNKGDYWMEKPELQKDWRRYGEDDFEFKVLRFCAGFNLRYYESVWIAKLAPHYNGQRPQVETHIRIRHKLENFIVYCLIGFIACCFLIAALIMIVNP